LPFNHSVNKICRASENNKNDNRNNWLNNKRVVSIIATMSTLLKILRQVSKKLLPKKTRQLTALTISAELHVRCFITGSDPNKYLFLWENRSNLGRFFLLESGFWGQKQRYKHF